MSTPAPDTRPAAAIKFKWQKPDDAKVYDYFVPEGLTLAPGDKVIVETKRGETEVEVVELKASSDRADKSIIRRAEPKAEANEKWDF